VLGQRRQVSLEFSLELGQYDCEYGRIVRSIPRFFLHAWALVGVAVVWHAMGRMNRRAARGVFLRV